MAITATGVTGSSADGSAGNVTMSGNIVTGDCAVAVIRISDSTSTNSAFGNGTNAFTLAGRQQALSLGLEIWYCWNMTAETTPAWATTGAAAGRVRVAVFNGVLATDPKDVSVFTANGSGTAFSGGTTGTTAQANNLVIGGFVSAQYQTTGRTYPAGYTGIRDDENRTFLEYSIKTDGPTTYNPTMTGADGGNWLGAAVVFKDATAGGSSGQPTMRRWGGAPHVGGQGVNSAGGHSGKMWGRSTVGLWVPSRKAA